MAEASRFLDMTPIVDAESTQCAVYDQTPGSQQKKICIVVRPHFTVARVFSDILIQYSYNDIELLLQPYANKDLVYLNDFLSTLLYEVPGFDRNKKNYLVLLPNGTWDKDVKKRYDLPMLTTVVKKTKTTKTVKTTKRTEKKESAVKNAVAETSENNNATFTTTTITSTTTSSSNCSSSNNNTNNMEIENTLTESTKAAITEQLTQILPHNLDSVTDSFNLSPVSDPEQLSDDDLALGASASPTEIEPHGTLGFGDAQGSSGNRHQYEVINEIENLYDETPAKNQVTRLYNPPSLRSLFPANGAKGYVGLVNQAMTCYLNSLLQALYMTPEFRNALYRWEFDHDNEDKNIPYQLQKLFLNLQTSPKSSVETTDLTRSFGWDSTEAWQQHDIQELCRVMFDALEHKSKNTKQAHFISNLYEGKMLDYVKCLECNTEKTREDTFLDIPLPVRPFGSNVAYDSIEEALRAFVQPETLDGNNQYSCDSCNKKCDAHKGLKFKTFPYVLTLHLKRFDFDYQTMHRIKLNDRVTFPQSLNLNSFVNSSEGLHNLQNGNGVTTNIDDYSTADSGSAMEEDNLSSGVVTTASSSQHENDINDEDEGIDMSTSTDHRSSPKKNAAVERLKQESGPYLYELFAIMIHSGSASGGHYYAYIKDFENNEWFCFNDQSVSPITQEDIQKSFGGGSHGSYYSSVYTSSTNAYMLMYRQVDPKRNEGAIKVDEFPDHIKTLLPKLHSEEESKSTRLGRHSTVTDLALPDFHKPRVYFYNPSMKKLKVTRIYYSPSFDVSHYLESAYSLLDVEKFAPLDRCRLVAYDSTSEEIIQSLETATDPSLKDLRSSQKNSQDCLMEDLSASQNHTLDFLLEYRLEGHEFEVYEKNGTTWLVYMIDPATMVMDGPFIVYSAAREQSDVLRHSIAVRLHIKENEFLLATLKSLNKKAFVAYDPQPTAESQEHLQNIVNAQFKYLTYFYLNVPNTDARNLEILGIPPFEIQTPPSVEISSDVVDAVMMNSAAISSSPAIGDSTDNFQHTSYNRESPLPPPTTTPGHESNSEDSSLSDGDRTLVESMQHRGGGDSQVSSTSHSPQLSSPEDEAASHDSYMRVQALYNGYSDSVDTSTLSSSTSHFFHASKVECMDLTAIQTCSLSDDDNTNRKPTHSYKILVGSHMRMGAFKRHIENLIQVPANYFKLQRKNDRTIPNNPTNPLVFLNEGDTLTVELGKILQPDEYKAKIYFMRLADLSNDTGKLPCVCEWVYHATTTTEMAKKELVAKLHRIDASYQTLTVENCRVWLKGGRSPIKILENDETLHSDIRTTIASEFLIQECEVGKNPQPPEDTLTIFVRQWHPDKLQFDHFQEITLDRDSEIRNAISKYTDIEEENIAYTKINSTFPCTNTSVLSVNGSMSWFSIPATLDKYPLTTTLSGHVYFYKDVTKAPKELTTEERNDLSAKEKARLDRLFSLLSSSSSSPRRERGLKIHLDSPQKPNENTDVASNSSRKD